MHKHFKNSSIASRITEEKVKRGGGYGLEIPCEYLVKVTKKLWTGFCKSSRKKKIDVKC